MRLVWIAYKDALGEWRSCQVWPSMLVLGAAVACLFVIQTDQVGGGPQSMARQFWLTTFFAGILAFNRSFDAEKEARCWDALVLYPVEPATIYLAKLLGNFAALAVLQVVLLLVFGFGSDPALLRLPWHLATVALLGNLGIAALGTLIASLFTSMRQGPSLLAVLVLPLATPVLLVATQATRLILEHDLSDRWWQAVTLLALFAAVFCTTGLALSPFILEE